MSGLLVGRLSVLTRGRSTIKLTHGEKAIGVKIERLGKGEVNNTQTMGPLQE